MNRTKRATVCLIAICTLFMVAGGAYGLPSFVTDPPEDEQYYYDFGEAEGYDATRAWAHAEERARESVRYQIETRVEAMQIDYEAQTGRRAENFFTEVRQVVSDVTVQTQKVKSESEGNKYYVLVRTAGIEEKVLELVKEHAQKTNDPGFERSAKEAMKRAFDKAAAVIQQAEEAWERRERENFATRTSFGTNLALEWSEDKLGMGIEWLEWHWSFLPFTSVGIGVYPFTVGGYSSLGFEAIALGGSLYAGFVFPLTANESDFNVRLYTDFVFTVQGVFDEGFIRGAGFDAGLALTWDGLGFDIRYRGLVYENHYVNSLCVGFVWMFND